MRVLLVEDNKLLAQGVMLSLAKEGIQVDHLPSYKQAEVALNNEDFKNSPSSAEILVFVFNKLYSLKDVYFLKLI